MITNFERNADKLAVVVYTRIKLLIIITIFGFSELSLIFEYSIEAKKLQFEVNYTFTFSHSISKIEYR